MVRSTGNLSSYSKLVKKRYRPMPLKTQRTSSAFRNLRLLARNYVNALVAPARACIVVLCNARSYRTRDLTRPSLHNKYSLGITANPAPPHAWWQLVSAQACVSISVLSLTTRHTEDINQFTSWSVDHGLFVAKYPIAEIIQWPELFSFHTQN